MGVALEFPDGSSFPHFDERFADGFFVCAYSLFRDRPFIGCVCLLPVEDEVV